MVSRTNMDAFFANFRTGQFNQTFRADPINGQGRNSNNQLRRQTAGRFLADSGRSGKQWFPYHHSRTDVPAFGRKGR